MHSVTSNAVAEAITWQTKNVTVSANTTTTIMLLPEDIDYECIAYEEMRHITYHGIHPKNGGAVVIPNYATPFGGLDNSALVMDNDYINFMAQTATGNVRFYFRPIMLQTMV